jgi:large subunit ribosomal protein L23
METEEKKVEAKAEVKPEAKAEPKAEKAPAKKAEAKKAPAKEAPKKSFPKATAHDYEVIKAPHITEKSMALMQNANKVTVRVSACANKAEIKAAFERVFQVQVDDVKVVNQRAKTTTRGGRYQGQIAGYKKAIVTLHEGSAIDLFKE